MKADPQTRPAISTASVWEFRVAIAAFSLSDVLYGTRRSRQFRITAHVPTDPLLDATTEADAVSAGAPVDIAGLFREHNAALLRFAAAKLGSEQEARDVAQEAYVRLLQLDRPETIGYLRAFLFKIVANLATDRLRARRRAPMVQTSADEDLVTFELSPERQCVGLEMVAVLNTALAELPSKCRKILILHRLEGLSRAEIAERTGLGERMVRLYMARALEHLQRRIDEASGTRSHP